MAYFAINCVAGREMFVKNAIEMAAHNHNRKDIIDIIVPAQITIDLTDVNKKSFKAKSKIPYASYVFINVKTNNDSVYEEISADLYQFLNNIPNVKKIIVHSISHDEIHTLLNLWEEINSTETFIFKVACDDENQKQVKSPLTTALIAKKKVISDFKRFVQAIFTDNVSHCSGITYTELENEIIVHSPLHLILKSLKITRLTMEQFMKAPHLLLQSLSGVQYATDN